MSGLEKPSFKKGDKVVYPGQGVAQIVEVTDQYHLKFPNQSGTVFVPIGNETVMRPLSSIREVSDFFQYLRAGRPALIQEWKGLHFEKQKKWAYEKIRKGALQDLGEILRLLCVNSWINRLTSIEKQIFDKAKGLAADEIAEIDLRPGEKLAEVRKRVDEYIESCLQKRDIN